MRGSKVSLPRDPFGCKSQINVLMHTKMYYLFIYWECSEEFSYWIEMLFEGQSQPSACDKIFHLEQ